MNSKGYRWCAVPQCHNTSIKTPNKLFVFVPHKKKTRNMWLKLARRDLAGVHPATHLYFCEDHFDMPNDMENYMQYHLMGSVSRIRMKQGCVPTKFFCQPDRRKRTCGTTQRQYILKKQRQMAIEECEKELKEKKSSIPIKKMKCAEVGRSELKPNKTYKNAQETENKCYPVQIIKINLVNHRNSLLKPFCQTASTPSFNNNNCSSLNPMSDLQKYSTEVIIKRESDDEISDAPFVTCGELSPSRTQQIETSSDCSELIQDDKQLEGLNSLKYTFLNIKKEPT